MCFDVVIVIPIHINWKTAEYLFKDEKAKASFMKQIEALVKNIIDTIRSKNSLAHMQRITVCLAGDWNNARSVHKSISVALRTRIVV